MERKPIAIIAIVFVVVGGLLSYSLRGTEISDFRIIIENVSLDKSEVRPGEEVKIYTTVSNDSRENDATGVTVKITSPVSHILITKNTVELGTIGAGGSRSTSFTVSVQKNAYEGSYRIKIKTSADKPFKGTEEDIYLRVSKKS